MKKSFSFSRGESLENHSGLTKDQVMIRTFVAMCIPAVAAIFAMGTNALYNILTALITTLVFHYIIKAFELKTFSLKIFKKSNETTYQSPYSPLVAGMIVGLCVGELTPYYITAIISILTLVVFKWGQENFFERKVVNPAAAGKAIFLLVLTLLWFLPDSLEIGMLFYPEHLDYALYTEDGFLGAMELAEQIGFYGTENLSVTQSLILWKEHGWIGGASGLAVLASGVLLGLWIKLKWRITISYLVVMTILSIILGLFTGGHIPLRIAYHVFTGSVVFLAVYMATDPKTTPVTWKGQYIFGLVLGILTMGLQLVGLFGSSFIALVILNPYSYVMDRIGMKLPFGSIISSAEGSDSDDALTKYLRFPSPGWDAEDIKTKLQLDGKPQDCLRCGFCVEVCPKDLHPALAMDADDKEDDTMMEHAFPSECLNCELCAYVCPALIQVPAHLEDIQKRIHV